MRRHLHSLLLTCLVLNAYSGGGGGDGDDGGTIPPPPSGALTELPPERAIQGGDTTTFNRTALAFENPAANLSDSEVSRHFDGDAAFAAQFVSPPADLNPGLGPVFNSNSCEGCHTKNGRGQPVFGNGPRGSQAVLRVSVDDGVPEAPGGPGIVPGLGTQLQDHAIIGAVAEATIELTWKSVSGKFGDGTSYNLRRPSLNVTLSDGSRLPSNVHTSMRSAPPIFGLGLLEAVPQSSIEALADPGDANGDGISGKPNFVYDVVLQSTTLGRFGRKANRPNLLQQTASAYANDIGVTNPVFPAPDGLTEIDGATLTAAEFYTQSLSVPNAGDINDPQVKAGERLFLRFNCSGCHQPELRTGSHPSPSLSNQRIFPYTDMLLHDMGEGLADGRSDFQADGNEWRTTPLWGVGVTATILSATQNYLHDGRARTLEEAILWHGGEAEVAKEGFRTSSKEEREALIRFLKSL